MKQKLQIALVCVALVGLSLWASWPKREPSWGGKTVSEWLVELAPAEDKIGYGEMSHSEWLNVLKKKRERRERGQTAIQSLGERAVPYVLALLEEPNKRMQWIETVTAKLGMRLPEPPSKEIRIDRAALAFAALGTNAQSALPKLGQMLRDTNTMAPAALCLGHMAPASVPLLLSGLASSNELLREACISRIGHGGTNASIAVPAVLAAVADSNPKVARAAAFIYPSMEPDKHKLIATLLHWSRSSAVNVHSLINAMKTVGYFRRPHGPEVQPLISELLRLADDPDSKIQAGAISTLGSFGELAAAARPKVIAALQSELSDIRLSACSALGGIRLEPDSSVPLLIKLAQVDASESVRSSALHAAAAFGEIGLPFCGPLRAEVEKAIQERAEEDRLWNRTAPK